MSWNKLIPEGEITDKVTEKSVSFAEEFSDYLAKGEKETKMTTSQIRKFFGEVKRLKLKNVREFDLVSVVMLKPKLAYAVGRAKNKNSYWHFKIEDFYVVMADAIDKIVNSPDPQKAFNNFITVFEAIVAYHKAAENNNVESYKTSKK
ncbi:MAG: type III-A CRISPR-associated protein Csm2 [Bacteroidales bacterium]|nr:type III-A CRISPR-associated protein Csm2 [Bacteroidales bacterium]